MKQISEVLTINSKNEIVSLNSRRGIKRSEIEGETMVCPYCMSEVKSDQQGCCHETSAHFDKAYAVGDELILKSECIVLEDQ